MMLCKTWKTYTPLDSVRMLKWMQVATLSHNLISENGDRKKARRRLKSPVLHKSHHFSTFCSGIYIGLAIPVLVSAAYSSATFISSMCV
ncbi:hypothetical protein JB92DRAFT_3032620 [Gautieria morchelliformis]|nr:hypothetical protein JB92DRAFT_3032620 [Gautieria morchelliformis]